MRKYLAFAGVSALLLWPVVFSTPYDIRLMTLAGVFAIAVIGYQFIFGNVGELSLAQAGFFGLGAYVTGILAVKLDAVFPATFAMSMLLPVLLAAIISMPLLRLATHYYALATLGIAQTLYLLSIDWVSLTDGAIGLTGVPLPVVFAFQVPRGIGLLAFVWLYVGVAAVFAMQTRRGMYGLGCQLIRSNPMAAQAIGIDPNAVRFRMLLLSAAFAGAAGALHAHTTRMASPGTLEFKVTATILAMVVIGGRTSVWGGIAAAILLVHMPEWLKGFEQAHLLVTSTVLLVILYVAPSGFAGLVDKIWPADRENMRPEGAPLMKLGSSHAHAIPPDTSASDDGAILTVKGLFKTFGGIHALDDVNFSLKRGSITALIGPNGSGKSTFINCVTGVYRPDGGQVALKGTSLVGVRPNKIVKPDPSVHDAYRCSSVDARLPHCLAQRIKECALGRPRQTDGLAFESVLARTFADPSVSCPGGRGEQLAPATAYRSVTLLAPGRMSQPRRDRCRISALALRRLGSELKPTLLQVGIGLFELSDRCCRCSFRALACLIQAARRLCALTWHSCTSFGSNGWFRRSLLFGLQ
jgi:branched-chain amino acid transport system permease protein